MQRSRYFRQSPWSGCAHYGLAFLTRSLQVRAREEAALIAAQTEADKYGNGVTAEAQDIFFALSKTCASLWSRSFAESFYPMPV